MPIIYDLLEHEGLCLGGSSGINVAGAIRLGKQLGPGKTIVTILCDSGSRYQSKLFNPEFMRSKNLPVPGVAGEAQQDRRAVREDIRLQGANGHWRMVCLFPSRNRVPQDLAEEQLGPLVLRVGEEILPACWTR